MSTSQSSVWKSIQASLNLSADGIPGVKTCNAVAAIIGSASTWKAVQKTLGITADGIPGINTANAVSKAISALKGTSTEVPVESKENYKPLVTQAKLKTGTSIYGKAGDSDNLVTINFPYPMLYDGKPVTRFTCHKLVAPRFTRIFERVRDELGEGTIKKLGLNIYGGCYNNRSTTNGASKSVHAWGMAMDIDPDRNTYAMKSPKARLSQADALPFWKIVKEEGGLSLGQQGNYDWMHFQFTIPA